MLIANGRNKQQTHNVIDRMRHSFLSGADLYVARFGNGSTAPGKQKRDVPKCEEMDNTEDTDGSSLSPFSTSTACSSTTTGSLHDELRDPNPHPALHARSPESDPFDWTSVHASRPCYRCVSYMHSVGIKRVFWTNDDGQWEGAKVRDLVDALDMSEHTSSEEGRRKLIESGVFITKHEVLMMRRVMGRC
jgi:hypothetical protein